MVPEENQEDIYYSDTVKRMLDERYSDYIKSNIKLISAEVSQQQIYELLTGTKIH